MGGAKKPDTILAIGLGTAREATGIALWPRVLLGWGTGCCPYRRQGTIQVLDEGKGHKRLIRISDQLLHPVAPGIESIPKRSHFRVLTAAAKDGIEGCSAGAQDMVQQILQRGLGFIELIDGGCGAFCIGAVCFDRLDCLHNTLRGGLI